MLLECFSFSRPETISGAWVTGFETNEFYEGKRALPALVNTQVGETQLQMTGAAQLGPRLRLFQLKLVGRRSSCDMRFPHHLIVVDKVLARQEIGLS